MHIFPFKASFPNFDFIASADSFFANVKRDYAEYAKSGFFQRSEHPGIYIHEITTSQRTYTGLEACLDIRDYEKGLIKKHENTLPAKEQTQMQLLLQRRAMVKPVLLFHQPLHVLNDLIATYKATHSCLFEIEFDAESTFHKFWKIEDAHLIDQIKEIYTQQVPECYIADGHHRSSTVALLHQRLKEKKDGDRFQYLHCALYAADQLEVLDYNRLIEPLTGISPSRFMARISQLCDIQLLDKPAKPSAKHHMTMCINTEWYALQWKPHLLQATEGQVILDASLLDRHVFYGILNMEDVRTADNLSYVEGPKGLSDFQKPIAKNEIRVGFCLYPVVLDDLKKVADLLQVMPPKSTWFEPRMKNGLLVYEV